MSYPKLALFLYSLFLTLLVPQWMPIFYSTIPLFFFASYLVQTVLQKSLPWALGLAILIGVVIDLAHSTQRFGITPLASVCALTCLSRKKQLFFHDHFWTIPLMSLLYSLLFRTLVKLFCFLLGSGPAFHHFFWDICLMPMADGLFSLVGLIAPLHFYKNKRQKRKALERERKHEVAHE